MRTHLYASVGVLKIGNDILFNEEKIKVDRITGHGGLFRTKGVGQRILAAAINSPISVMETAGEGGAWGIALLASYLANNGNDQSQKAVLVSLEPQKDKKTGRMQMVPVPGSEKVVDANLVLIAAGFTGSQKYVTDAFGVSVDARTNVATKEETYETNVPGVFAAGDVRRGQSLVVWAIQEGKQAAKAVDYSLMGYTNL